MKRDPEAEPPPRAGAARSGKEPMEEPVLLSPADAQRRRAFDYHERTKHHLARYAKSLGYLDWNAQPHPFRSFHGCDAIPLGHPPIEAAIHYDALFVPGAVPTVAVNPAAISRLFYHSLAISAWKKSGASQPWSLRINPSSGCLHPTEGYLLCGPDCGLAPVPTALHYQPYQHALEARATLDPAAWNDLVARLPAQSMLVALTSIYWREAWKYGERALRYCHHDVGHAIGAMAFAAATLGWTARLTNGVADEDLAKWIGIDRQSGPEAEHPDAMIVIYPNTSAVPPTAHEPLPLELATRLAAQEVYGTPNVLSALHHPWPVIDEAAAAMVYDRDRAHVEPLLPHASATPAAAPLRAELADRGLPAEQVIRQRRSAVDLDGLTPLDRAMFYRLLMRLQPSLSQFPFDTLAGPPQVALALFVHRVQGLAPGLYLLARDASHLAELREALDATFVWQQPDDCPAGLELWMLCETDCRDAARVVSCHQEIASDGVFSLGMLARFRGPIRAQGAAIYPRLFWECGLVGQVLYLEAEAAGLRGTGIGCYFDDAMHSALALGDEDWQSLYHFTIGGPIDDPRLETIPPYAHLTTGDAASGENS